MSTTKNFDLNIDNYKKKELEDIFELPENYDNSFVKLKSNKLIDNIKNDSAIEKNVKNNTINFINKAAELLLKSTKSLNNFKKLADSDIYNLDYKLKTSKVENNGDEYMIIEKKPTPYTQSLPSEFYHGVINPLKKRILNNSINIDTRFRDNYYTTLSTNFHLDLPIQFINVVSLQLSAFELPITTYAISKQFGTNYFWISACGENGNDFEKLCIIIENGNYSPCSLVEYINSYITTNIEFIQSTYLKYLCFSLNIGDPSTGSGQIVVSISPNYTSGIPFSFNLNFQLDFNGNPDYGIPLPLKIGWIMGFRQGEYTNNILYISEGICDTSGPNYMFLVVDDYNNSVNNNFYSAFNSSILNKNILARISLLAPPFNNLSQNNLNLITTPRQYFGPVNIQKLNIQLLDEYGRIIDLNNMDFSFCLTMQVVYDL